MKCRKLYLLVLFLNIACIQHFVLGNHEEDSWVDPDAWGREHHLQHNVGQSTNELQLDDCTSGFQCKVLKGARHDSEAIALMYYKRLISYLFKTELFKRQEALGVLKRAFILTVLPDQLEQLKNLNDPRDLDSILSEIFLKESVPSMEDFYSIYGKNDPPSRVTGFFALIWDIIKVLGKLLKTSEAQFLLGAASLIFLAWYCHRKYRIGIITMIIGAIVCFGYFHTYLECNRKLEAERMLEELTRTERQKPIPTWYSSITNFFFSNENDEKQTSRDFIKKSSQLNLNFCRPDHVFLMYANDLFLKQLQFLIDKCHETIASFRESLAFPFNYLASILLMFLIAYIVKLTFKYILSPRAWVGVWHARASYPNGLPITPGTAHLEDRISGENLKMFLNAISSGPQSKEITIGNTTATAYLTQSATSTSGVQEIQGVIENGNVDTESESSLTESNEKSTTQGSPLKQVETLDNNSGSEKQCESFKETFDNNINNVKIEEDT